jgi:hypothetical protein
MAEQAWFSDDGKRYATELEALEADLKHWRVCCAEFWLILSPADALKVKIHGCKEELKEANLLILRINEEQRQHYVEPTHTMYDQHP